MIIVSTLLFESKSSMLSVLANARDKTPSRYELMGEQEAALQTAIEAAFMWNLIYVPVEYGPILPVRFAFRC